MPWIIVVTLIICAPLVLLYYYVGKRLINSFALKTRWRRDTIRQWYVGIAVYANLLPLLFVVLYALGGRTRIPMLSGESFAADLLFAYPFWIGLVIVVQLFLVVLVADLVRLLLRPVYRRVKEKWDKNIAMLTISMLAVISCYSLIIIIKDTWTISVNQRTVPLQLPVDGWRMDIVLISDVQGDGRTDQDKISRYVERINQLGPDVLLFAGDLVTSGEKYIASSAALLGRIHTTEGMIAAVGDHDMFSNKEFVIREMRDNGFTIADDTTYVLTVDAVRVAITVLTQTYLQRPEEEVLERLANGSNADVKILLVHQPAEHLVRYASENGYRLFLAGHTHGGGVAFGIPGVYLFAPANLESRYVSGFYDVGTMLVAVTNGLGMTLAPIRFHAPAEIMVLRLTSQ